LLYFQAFPLFNYAGLQSAEEGAMKQIPKNEPHDGGLPRRNAIKEVKK